MKRPQINIVALTLNRRPGVVEQVGQRRRMPDAQAPMRRKVDFVANDAMQNTGIELGFVLRKDFGIAEIDLVRDFFVHQLCDRQAELPLVPKIVFVEFFAAKTKKNGYLHVIEPDAEFFHALDFAVISQCRRFLNCTLLAKRKLHGHESLFAEIGHTTQSRLHPRFAITGAVITVDLSHVQAQNARSMKAQVLRPC
jgi:hypothetical protein